MDRTIVLSYDTAIEIGGSSEQMHLRHGPFRWPWQCAGAIRSASPNAAWPGLPRKPLDATIGQLLAPYRPSGSQGDNQINFDATFTHFVGRCDGHCDVGVLYRVHCSVEEVRGFHKNHYMPPLDERSLWYNPIGYSNSGYFGHFIVKQSSSWHVGP